MSGTIRGGRVPIVFSYRRVTEQPTLTRHRRFVGWKRVLGTLVHRALEWVEELAYEVEREVEEAGIEEAVHWALQVDDPWGPDHQSQLIVTRVPERIDGCLNFEIIRLETQEPQEQPEQEPIYAPRPANHEQARTRMAAMLEREGQFEPPLPAAVPYHGQPQPGQPYPGQQHPGQPYPGQPQPQPYHGYAPDYLQHPPQVNPVFPPSFPPTNGDHPSGS